MRMLDMFSGIGGFSLAAQWAGIDTVAFVENDKFCQRVLAKHWPDVPCFGDIFDVTEDDVRGLGRIDIVCGGFPCQPFSVAGKQAGQSDDRYLWPQMSRLIEIAKPAWVVAENVPGIIHLALDDVLLDLEAKGYEARAIVFPACGVGAQHIRQRVFIVAYAESAGAAQNARGVRTRLGGVDRGKTPVAKDVADDDGERCEERQRWNQLAEATGERPLGWSHARDGRQWEVEPDVGRVVDGLSAGLDGNRRARLRALGNAVVPQQVYPILKLIAESEQ